MILRRLTRILAMGCFTLAACRGAGVTGGDGEPKLEPGKSAVVEGQPVRDEMMESAFKIEGSPWRGSDADYSVPLGPDRILWLFGDTWIVPEGALGREGGRLIRNTLAIQRIDPEPPHASRSVEFYWGTDPTNDLPLHAAAAFAPPNASGNPGGDPNESWYWPLSGLRLGERLVLFMSRLVHSDEGFGFASAGNGVVVVENPDDPPAQWRWTWRDIPFFKAGKTGDRAFGTASVVEVDGRPRLFVTDPAEARRAVVHVFGVNENWLKGFGGRSITAARVPAAALMDSAMTDGFSAWEFHSKDGWTRDVEKIAGMFDHGGSEMSVSPAPGGRWIAVYTEFGLGEKILARVAPRPEGPWSDPRVVYRVPDVEWSKDYFTYAGKAHPELAARPDELVITYAVNSKNFADHFNDLRIYWPRFIRATMPDF